MRKFESKYPPKICLLACTPSPMQQPMEVTSAEQITQLFGPHPEATFNVRLGLDDNLRNVRPAFSNRFFLHDALSLFFMNQGKECTVVSVATYRQGITPQRILDALPRLETLAPALVYCPDISSLSEMEKVNATQALLSLSKRLPHTFFVLDTPRNPTDLADFRGAVSGPDLHRAAAYWPHVEPEENLMPDAGAVRISQPRGPLHGKTLNEISKSHRMLFRQVLAEVEKQIPRQRYLPPGGLVLGTMYHTDLTQGVWKAPAGLEVSGVKSLEFEPTQTQHQDFVSGDFTVNPLRTLQGGIRIWGARTVKGNIENKYISASRLATEIEKNLTAIFDGFPKLPSNAYADDAAESAAKSLLQLYFTSGAFQGDHDTDAFFAKVQHSTGGTTLIAGFAALKPREFVVVSIPLK